MKSKNEEGFLDLNQTMVSISEERYNELLSKERSLKATQTYFEDVGHFHLKMRLPVEQYFVEGATLSENEDEELQPSMIRTPDEIDNRELNYRTHFMFEELKEFIEATAQNNILDQADALADLVWVALGTAHTLGIPFDRVWAEVRRANMEKRPWQEGDPVKPRNAPQFEVVKPKGWRAPDIDEAIFPSFNPGPSTRGGK